jgi:hypothetical protein
LILCLDLFPFEFGEHFIPQKVAAFPKQLELVFKGDQNERLALALGWKKTVSVLWRRSQYRSRPALKLSS